MRRSDESEAKKHQPANPILSYTKLARSFILWVVSRVHSSSLSGNLLLLLLCHHSEHLPVNSVVGVAMVTD
jgi:hypothetical protein